MKITISTLIVLSSCVLAFSQVGYGGMSPPTYLPGTGIKMNGAEINVDTNYVASQAQINDVNKSLIMKLGSGTISYSNLYYLASGSTWSNASAVTNSTSQGLLGLALGSSVETNGLLLNGLFSNVWNFDSGLIIYVGTNGLTVFAPTNSGNIVRIVGYSIDTNYIYFNPDRTFIQLQ